MRTCWSKFFAIKTFKLLQVDTKSIDMARAALLNGGGVAAKGSGSAGKNRTYSRATGNMVPPGHLPQLNALNIAPGVLEHCGNEAAGDSTEEEEADNWDSNVSTTIDRTLNTQQQQNNHHLNHSISNHNSSTINNGKFPSV